MCWLVTVVCVAFCIRRHSVMTDSKHDSEVSDDDIDDLPAAEAKAGSGMYTIAAPLSEVAATGRRLREAEVEEIRGENVVVVFRLPDGSALEQSVSTGGLRAAVTF